MSTSIQEYSETEAALATLTQRYGGTVYEVRTPTGMVAARKGRAELRGYRTALETRRVEIKAPALARCRDIDGEAKRITSALLALEDPIDAAIKVEENRIEEVKKLKEREAAEALARDRVAVDAINRPEFARLSVVAEIRAQLDRTSLIEVGAYALTVEAAAAKSAAIVVLSTALAAAERRDVEVARMAAERAEIDRLRAEQAARDAVRAEEERTARARIEAEERAARERIEAEERVARAEREAADRAARAEREKAEAAQRAEFAAEQKKLRVERERIEAGRMADEELRRIEQRKSEQRLDARAMLATFVERFGELPEFVSVTESIKIFLALVKS